MNEDNENQVPLLTEVKLQAEVLIPILQELRKEIGEEKSDALVYGALRNHIRSKYYKLGEEQSGNPYEKWKKAWDKLRPRIGENVEREYLQNDDNGRIYNVNRCGFAEYFRSQGEHTLGSILMCDFDHYIAEIGKPIVALTRNSTIMEGAKQCDFCYCFSEPDKVAASNAIAANQHPANL